MGDTNHQHFNGSVGTVNGIKADKVYIVNDKAEQTRRDRRSKMLKEILYYRHHSKELHYILCNYARDAFQIQGDVKFIDLPDHQLEKLYQFSQPLKKVIFVYRTNLNTGKYKWLYHIAYLLHRMESVFRKNN